LSAQVAHWIWQLGTHVPAVLGLNPGMQVVQMPLLQAWHLSGQEIQAELMRESPPAQEVH
jgi:hypothetical protein